MNPFPTAFTLGETVELQREHVRSRLAYIVLLLLVALTIAIVVVVMYKGSTAGTRLLIVGLFTPIIGIAGTVLGFYFGAETQKNS